MNLKGQYIYIKYKFTIIIKEIRMKFIKIVTTIKVCILSCALLEGLPK